jgi:hypothetical protein
MKKEQGGRRDKGKLTEGMNELYKVHCVHLGKYRNETPMYN